MEKYKVNSNTVDSVKKIGNAIGRIPHPSAKIASTAINKSSKIVGNGLNRVNNAIKNHNMSEQEVMASNKDKFINNSSPLSKVFGFGNKKSSSLFFGDGNFSKRLWNRIPTGLKIKLIVGGGACLLLLLMVYTVFAQDDVHNLSLTNGTSISGSSAGSRKCSAEEVENRLLYVGDSRTVGMQSSIENENVNYIAEVGKGYEWFNSTALPNIESKLQEKTNAVIVLGLGVNDLYNIDNYITAYKSLIAKYPNNNFYILSVNPVDESKTVANGYTVTNADIEAFNKKLADNFSNNYIDSYSSLSNIGTSDGLHYDSETYKTLNGIVTSNISSSGKIMCGSSGSIGDISDDLLDGGNGQIMSGGKTLISILGESELNSLNENIKNNVDAVGYGTGLAPATAATTLIQSLLDKNIIIPYFWGGGHGTISTGANGNWGSYEYVGAGGHSTSFSRQPSGLDCSGFVSWALYNGGCKNFYPILADDFKNYGSSISINEAKVGDIAASNSHVVLILENRGDKLLVAEAKGTAYGVIFSERSSSGLNGYKIVDMENYYQKNCS